MRDTHLSAGHILRVMAAVAATTALAAGALAINACGASIVVIECDQGLELCDQKCVDLDDDEDHCGGCDEICDTTCVAGECQPPGPQPCPGPDCQPGCDAGLTACADFCVDLQTDVEHCGACFLSCTDGATCTAGTCQSSCICDRCDIVELQSTPDVLHNGSTAGAPDHTGPSCSGFGSPDVAHRYVAPSTGVYWFDTAGTGFDTVISLLVSCSEVVCVDDTELGSEAYATMLLEAGQEVVIVVESYGGEEIPYTLRIYPDGGGCVGNLIECNGFCVDISSDVQNCGACGHGCDFDESCIDFSCQCTGPGCGCELEICGTCAFVGELGSDVPASISGSTEGMPDGLTPSCTGNGGSEALHLFTAPFSADYVFDTLGSSFDTVLTVLDTNSCGEIACNDDFSNLDSQVVVPLFEGQVVAVVVDSLGSPGFYNLNVDAIEGPPSPSPSAVSPARSR